ncbi:MAG: hypothetical protein QXS02_00550 [Candidatus Thermoplasmatota archaeon]
MTGHIENKIWSEKDERCHDDSVMEWWCPEVFFTSIEDNRRWCCKSSLTEWHYKRGGPTGSLINITLFDMTNNKCYTYHSRDDSKRLLADKERLYIKYKDCYIKGIYPVYEIFLHDENNDIELRYVYESRSTPHWVAESVTNGWLPMGFGFYRYGYIPYGTLTGSMRFNDERFTILGYGYYEHVWGDFSYRNPLEQISRLKSSIQTYAKLFRWWKSSNSICIPSSIVLSTDNNPFGYDWLWAVFDNKWSIFYGNILFWLMDGPAAGILILTKDGKKYTEYANIRFKYKKMRKARGYDFYYPQEIELKAYKDKEELFLNASMSTEPREFINRLNVVKYWKYFAICEAPGIIKGYYHNGSEEVKLNGACKIEPQRQISILGHNMLRLDITKPPKGLGVSKEFESHLLKKHVKVNLRLLPKPGFNWSFRRL